MWQSLLYKKYLPTLMMMPTAANFFNLVIDLGSGVNLLWEFLGKSYQERIFSVGVFRKGFFGTGFFRKLYQKLIQIFNGWIPKSSERVMDHLVTSITKALKNSLDQGNVESFIFIAQKLLMGFLFLYVSIGCILC